MATYTGTTAYKDNNVMLKFVSTTDKNFPITYDVYTKCFTDVLSKSSGTATPTTDAEK